MLKRVPETYFSSLGDETVTVTTEDRAGNLNSQTVSYTACSPYKSLSPESCWQNTKPGLEQLGLPGITEDMRKAARRARFRM